MQRKSTPVTWRFKGVSDALDSSTAFDGAMAALTNLVPDPTTSRLWQCRPAATKVFDLNAPSSVGPFSSGFSSGFQHNYFNGTGGFISVYRVIGDIVYGMAADSNFSGQDAPFAYDLATNSALLVAGSINATTLPNSPPTAGAWTPPQMALIGTKLMVAHGGFTGAGGNFIGWFDISTPNAPVWNAGNLSGAIQFTVAPTGVAQFFNRAYYLYNSANPAVIFSDVLAATVVTNASQVLTFGDNVPLTALGSLALSTTAGGIVQSLIVFKNVTTIYQVTGDEALSTTNPLTVNSLNVATGTLAPNTVCNTPKGLAFVSPDGVRVIGFDARVSDPIGHDGSGVTVPFILTSVPTRMVAACSGNVLRITTLNGALTGAPAQEYWYEFDRNIWTGPHTFPASLIEPWKATFIMAPSGITGSLWQSDPVQTLQSTFVENGSQLTWTAATALLPDTDQIVNVCITEAQLDLAVASGIGNISISLLDQAATVIDTVTIPPSTASQTLWGQFVWGQAQWGGGAAIALAPYQLQWHRPIVFARGMFTASAGSALGMKVGALHLRYQVLRQWINTQTTPAASVDSLYYFTEDGVVYTTEDGTPYQTENAA